MMLVELFHVEEQLPENQMSHSVPGHGIDKDDVNIR